MGARFEEVRALLDAVDDPRAAVCFDTCHAFASGYDIRTPGGVSQTLDELEAAVGLARVECIHANDSQTGLGSFRDRHANIGLGEIGDVGFRALLHEPRLQRMPFILEVPGADGQGPDKANLDALRRLAA